LVGAVASAHRVLIAPFWSELNRVVARDRSRRIDALATGGVDALLRGLPAVRRWDGRTLELDYPVTRTLHLAERGLSIVPSYFCRGTPVTLIDPGRRPVLVYPVGHAGTPAAAPDNASPMLVALLGRTRAACLAALRHPHTTTGLSHDLGISVGTASKQAAVLREAGLLHSQRAGAAVVHEVTALGAGLLADSSSG
jgi:DNA-binding transcriptional ArsR family regulator